MSTKELTIQEFLGARWADPIGDGSDSLECWGAGEYANCAKWSVWHERTIAAQRAIMANYEHACRQENNFSLSEPVREDWGMTAGVYEQVLRDLAFVHRDHPDWRADW